MSKDPGTVEIQVLGRSVKLRANVGEPQVARAVALLEETFRDMDRAYELTWKCPPAALDTTTWMLMGALNLAHRVVNLEQEADRHTQDLENTLSKLLDDVPDEATAPMPLFDEEGP